MIGEHIVKQATCLVVPCSIRTCNAMKIRGSVIQFPM